MLLHKVSNPILFKGQVQAPYIPRTNLHDDEAGDTPFFLSFITISFLCPSSFHFSLSLLCLGSCFTHIWWARFDLTTTWTRLKVEFCMFLHDEQGLRKQRWNNDTWPGLVTMMEVIEWCGRQWLGVGFYFTFSVRSYIDMCPLFYWTYNWVHHYN